MPDFLAFERVTALVCGGETTENKSVFDVVVPGGGARKPFGVSCKMAAEQPQARPSWFMEMSNSAKKFHDAFDERGIDWTASPYAAGVTTVRLVESWHTDVQADFDVSGSKYLVLSHDKHWSDFRIACLPINLQIVKAEQLDWVVEGRDGPSSIAGYLQVDGRRHRLWQLFPNSGGQLKYYPPIDWAEWSFGPFQLEKPPQRTLLQKVDDYFPGMWPTPNA